VSQRIQQLDLFGDSAAEASSTEPDPRVEELAAGLPALVRFGTCSWTFEGWHGEVYHERYRSRRSFLADSLAEYARYPLFRSVEIDRSFYQPVTAKVLADYAASLPQDFDAGMKVWDQITTLAFPEHPRYGEMSGQLNPHFLDPDLFASEVIAPIEESFSEHIGPLILSIPPTRGRADPLEFERRLGHFLARAPAGYRYAVELRDQKLLTPRYLAVLRDHGAAHVFNYWSRMPSVAKQMQLGALSGPFVVARLMLPPGARYQVLKDAWAPFDRIVEPQHEMRLEVLALLRAALEQALPAYVYVNNKAEGSSPLTIRALAEGLL